ncbi:DUF1707 SHOCT-like domain-containing protein [Nocardia sienata]|uniref:DUF1707 SHOCT-like domain-containing protein n=1 Tax=Nocardia sienata TaxID=248552 RepID=UPI0007A46482|nr:DUF1707 domain-containing protein [Nocardia sienata]
MVRREQVRARDSDRVEVCALLDAASADGQLSDAEHTARTWSAMRAKYTADLDTLIADLQIPGELAGAAILNRDRPARPWWVPVALLVAAAGLGAVVGLALPDDSAGAGGTAAGEAAADLATGSGLALFVDSYRREFGDTIIDAATVFSDRILVQRLERGEEQVYEFDGADFTASTSGVSSYSEGRPVDLADIDLPAVAAVLAGAPATVKLVDGHISHIGIGYELIAPEAAAPVLDIYVGDGSDRTATVQLSLDGTPQEVHPAD